MLVDSWQMKTSFLLHLLVYHAIETLRLLLAASEASTIAAVIRISVANFTLVMTELLCSFTAILYNCRQ